MRILIIHRELPFPADNGGRLRAAYMARYLASHHDAAMVCFSSGSDVQFPEQVLFKHIEFVSMPPKASAIWRFCSRSPSEVADLASTELAQSIARLVQTHDPQVILISEPALTPYLHAYSDRVCVLDYLMVMTLALQRLGDLSRGWRRLIWHARWYKAAAYQCRIASTFDLCLVNSEEDHQDLVATCPDWRRLIFFPNGLLLDEYPLGLAEPERLTLVYPGSVTYPPNRDAVQYMIDRILPLVRQQVPGVRLLVTGSIPVDGSAPQASGVEYTGRVPDVRPVIAAAWICVVPLRSGAGGTRFKLLESMALGTPLVSTSIGAEGMNGTHGANILIADTPEDFAASTIKVLQEPELRQRVSVAGRRLIEEHYDWNILGARVTKLLEELVKEKNQTSRS